MKKLKFSKLFKYKEFYIITALLFAFIIRIALILTSKNILEADECLWGIMALDILKYNVHPVFYYGQPYLGTLTPHIIAFLFWIFGFKPLILKFVSLAYFSLSFLISSYILIELKNIFFSKYKINDFFSITLPLFFLCFADFKLTTISFSSVGHTELFFFISLSILFILKYPLIKSTIKNNFIFVGFIGILSGFFLYQNFLYILCLLPCLIILLKEKFFNFKKLIIFLVLFIIGFSPVLVYNFQNKGLSAKRIVGSWGIGINKQDLKNIKNNKKNIFQAKIKDKLKNIRLLKFLLKKHILSFSSYNKNNALFFLQYIYLLFMVISIMFFLFFLIKNFKNNNVALFLLLLFIFSIIPFMVFQRPPRVRYLWQLICLLPIAVLFFICLINNLKIIKFLPANLIILFISILPLFSFPDDCFIKKQNNYLYLINTLSLNNIKYIYTDFYTCYPIIFYSHNNILASPAGGFYNEERTEWISSFINKQPNVPFLISKYDLAFNNIAKCLKNNRKIEEKNYIIFFNHSNIKPDELTFPRRFE